MPKPKRPLKVFLCHAHADRDPVRGLYTRLTKDGVDAWLDKAKLLPGQDWELEIRKAVREADVVVVCLSKQFNQAGFRQKEVRLALDTAMEKPEGEIFIIPARLEECDTLESLKKWHWVDLFEVDGYEELLRALYARAEKIDAILQFTTPIGFALSGRLMELEGRALRAEIMGDIWLARKTWYEIKQIQPSFPRVDIKIKELERELRLSSSDKRCRVCGGTIPANTRYCPVCGRNYFTQMNSWEEKKLVIGVISLLLIVCIVVWLLRSSLIEKWFPPIPVATETATITLSSQSITPSNTIEPSQTPTETTDTKGVSMMLVSAGEFAMGSDHNDDEKPIHNVYLDSFYIDKYEVTNKDFVQFLNDIRFQILVESGAFVKYGDDKIYQLACSDCSNVTDRIMWDGTAFTPISDFEKHPVVFVSWYGANAYCRWRGGSLPTEAQWEKAARGTDGRIYPSEGGMDSGDANYFNFRAGTVPVGSYKSGKSIYDVYDLAGNVWEWVNDWYYQSYYHISPRQNPLGPENGLYRVYRGGGWDSSVIQVQSTSRNSGLAISFFDNVGFRCIRDANP